MNVYLYASNNVYRNLLTTGKAVLLEIYFNVNEMHRIKKNYKKNYIWKCKFFLEKGGMRCKCCICIKSLHATFSLKMLQIGRKCIFLTKSDFNVCAYVCMKAIKILQKECKKKYS